MHSVVASLPARDHPVRRERERFLRGDACSALWSSAPRVPTLRVVPHRCVHAWKSHSKSNRPLSAVVAREHRRRRFRNRSASCARAPFDARPLWTRESRSATLHPGLGGARPRTKHPDFVSASPALAALRLPESPDPHRIGFEPDSACARSIGPGCTAVVRRCLRSSRTCSPVFLPAPRVTARACIVRARSRVSGNAVHVLGRRGRVMRSDRRLHSEPINFEEPCASCAPDAEASRFAPEGPSSIARLAPRAHPARRSDARLPPVRGRKSVHRRARGPSMGARSGERAFHDAQTAG